jgi:hypothetical protein
MTNKIYITAQQLLRDSFELGIKILESDFKPSFIIGVWRGGTPIGIAVQELLEFSGVASDHISVRTSSYNGIGKRNNKVRVHGLGYIVKTINAEDSLLIIDDVHDTGRSVQEIIRQLKRKCRKNTPKEIRVATLYFKPDCNEVDFQPDYYLHATNDWLIFPHELAGLSQSEVNCEKPDIDHIKRWLLEHGQMGS